MMRPMTAEKIVNNHQRNSKGGIILMMLLVFLVTQGWAQTYQKTDAGVKIVVDATDVEIQFYSPSIVRVLKSPHDKAFKKESLSVIKVPEKTIFTLKQDGNILQVQSKEVRVKLDVKTGAIIFTDAKGTVLLNEKPNGASFTPFNDAGNNTFSVVQAYTLDPDEAIYGLGQQQAGRMIQRNLTLNMIQGNTSDYVPFFVSVKGYGLFWDNYSPTVFTDNKENTSFKSDVGDCIDYYFMHGGNADGVIANMRNLTGQVPMFPLWTYGFFQSKERYKSQDETVSIIKKYRELGVQLDGIIQDWQYWGNNYLWNAMEFLNVEFPNPQKFVSDIHNLHAHLTISIWNSFGPQTKQYKELEKINALMSFG